MRIDRSPVNTYAIQWKIWQLKKKRKSCLLVNIQNTNSLKTPFSVTPPPSSLSPSRSRSHSSPYFPLLPLRPLTSPLFPILPLCPQASLHTYPTIYRCITYTRSTGKPGRTEGSIRIEIMLANSSDRLAVSSKQTASWNYETKRRFPKDFRFRWGILSHFSSEDRRKWDGC